MYVDKNGNHENDGSMLSPVHSIQYALDLIQERDTSQNYTIIINPGIYEENLNITRSNVYFDVITE